MWSVENKKLIEPRFLLALGVGVVVVIGIIALSLFIRNYTPSHGANRIDPLIPRSVIVYAHLDLGLLSRSGNTIQNAESWQKAKVKIELAMKKQLRESFDIQRLYKALGREAAFFVLPGNQGQAFIAEARSTKDFRAVIDELYPGTGEIVEYRGASIVSRPGELFSNLPFQKSETQTAPKIYWSEVKKNVFVIADTIVPIRAVLDVKNKEADGLADTIGVYRPNATLFSLWLKPAQFDLAASLPEQLRTYLGPKATAEEALYFQANIVDGSLIGLVVNHPPTLLEKLSAGDVANRYRQSARYFPPSFRLAWLGTNLRDVFQALGAAGTANGEESVFHWPGLFTNEFRFDWAKHVLPLVNLQTDMIIGQPPTSASDQQAFLLALQPNSPSDLNDVSNNTDALIKNILSVLSPRQIEKTLSDGTTVKELVPDAQAGNQKEFQLNGQAIQKLWQVELPGEKNTLVYGQLDNRVVVTNAPAIIEAIARQASAADAPACLSKISGQRLLIVNRDQLLLAPDYGQYASRLFVADASDDQNIYLTFCVEP